MLLIIATLGALMLAAAKKLWTRRRAASDADSASDTD